ncbi:MAG TPA: methylated-DNA--[protein]-cysteine S-methyltransferase [Longimicrobiales bacterium]|nr:methylated-DNA--[protein]-cysteine S-methyltransferase [Longimicrobiales bacterium]
MTDAGRDYRRVERAIRYIEEHAREQPDLDAVARAVDLSPHHFHRLFRRWAGITPKRFLQLLTLEHAKRRLDESRSVLETSFHTGLSGPGRLHDLFVTMEGVTPGEYRSGGRGVRIRYGLAPSPFGTALLAWTDRGVCTMAFTEQTPGAARTALAGDWPDATLEEDAAGAADRVERIFGGERVPLHVQGTNFQVRVWEALVQIPPGAVAAYEDVARGIGRPDAVRAVGSAIARNRIGWLIPCHRVIRKMGLTGGYRWGGARKRAMLAWEAARQETGGSQRDPGDGVTGAAWSRP